MYCGRRRGDLPDEVLYRKKSPFPKIYDPRNTKILAERLNGVLADATSPVLEIIDRKKSLRFIDVMFK